MRPAPALALALAAPVLALAGEMPVKASRAPEKGCAWSRLVSKELGLELVHQKCDFGYRTIDFGASETHGEIFNVYFETATRQSSSDPVIKVYEKKPDEAIGAAILRVAFAKATRAQKRHCSVTAKKLDFLAPEKEAYTISPDAQLADEAAAKAGDGVPDAACGPLGDQPDGLGYFEYHPAENPKRFAYVEYGQDEHPLFDEKSLKFLP